MSVESWDPAAGPIRLDQPAIDALLAAAGRLDEDRFGLDAEAAGDLARVARHDGTACDWAGAARELDDAALLALIRLFTLAEGRLSGWEAGDASPVIPLARELKRRGGYPADLTAWIKANTRNRFLPYGSLMDRL